MSCRAGCPTQDHGSWGECARMSSLQFGDVRQRETTKRWDGELSAYAAARRQGVQPAGTKMAQVQSAMKLADKTGIMSW